MINTAINNGDFRNLFINLLGGVLVILFVDGVRFVKKYYRAYRFKKIFGVDCMSNFLVVIGKMRLKLLYDERQNVVYYPFTKINEATSFRISEPVSMSETKSAMYISDTIVKNTTYSPKVIADEEIRYNVDISYCSLGGYNNYKTTDILNSDQNLFYSYNIRGEVSILSKLSQDLKFKIDDIYDYGLIIKIKNVLFPNRTQICIAGLGESGTTGAAWFLSKKWPELLRKVKDHDFGCIIRVEKNKDESSKIIDLVIQNKNGVSKIIGN